MRPKAVGAIAAAVLVAGGVTFGLTNHTSSTICHLSGKGLWVVPDRACTPGKWIDNGAGVCSKSYNPRPPSTFTEPIKRDVLRRYGIPQSRIGLYELDHLYPRWLGGATVEANLWPELNGGAQSAFMHNPKDRLEDELYTRVCFRRSMTVEQARRVFAGDWRRALRKRVCALRHRVTQPEHRRALRQ